jgi:polyhydroxyalkanoate synthase subunit PhaC
MKPGSATILGTLLDLSQVKTDMYVVGALTDHLVPWTSAYSATQAFGGSARFVLSNSGHIQALVNPPGNPKASYSAGEATQADPQVWLKSAMRESNSWWVDWADWTLVRSGEERPRPRVLGSKSHKIVDLAPGRYVRE